MGRASTSVGRGPWGMSLRQRAADLVDDVLAELGTRRARALLMVGAVALSCGALLASVGISRAASSQIGSDIAASTLDLVTVSVVPGSHPAGGPDVGPLAATAPAMALPDDTEERLAGVDLVEAAGRRLDVSSVMDVVVSRTPESGSAAASGGGAPDVVAATPGYLAAARVTGPEERFFHLAGTHDVVFLGPAAAEKLSVPVTDDPTGLEIWIDGSPYDVVGFLGDGGPAALGNAVVIPYDVGVDMTRSDERSTVLVRTLPGAGAKVAGVVTVVVRPDAPERLSASPVVSVASLRRGVSTQLDRLAAWTGAILMALTVLLIANSMVVAVMARTGEVGLRRALGMSRWHIASVFLAEGALIGLLGGTAGAAVATAAVVATSALNRWTVMLDPGWIAVGPFVGAAVGLIASAYPAWRAAQISPALAVRSE